MEKSLTQQGRLPSAGTGGAMRDLPPPGRKQFAEFFNIKQEKRMNKKLLALRLCLLMAVLLVPLAAAAQGVVAGRVFDSADRQPLPGVSVLVKGTQTGTITDADGNFSLTLAEPGQTLVFSFIGYATQEFTPPPPHRNLERV